MCLFIFSSCKNSKNEIDEIDTINFTYSGGINIPFNKLNIWIEKGYDSANVFIHSEPLIDEPKYQYSKIDTFISIDNKIFEELAKTIINLDKIDVNLAFQIGKDGYSCKIESEINHDWIFG